MSEPDDGEDYSWYVNIDGYGAFVVRDGCEQAPDRQHDPAPDSRIIFMTPRGNYAQRATCFYCRQDIQRSGSDVIEPRAQNPWYAYDIEILTRPIYVIQEEPG